MTQNKAFKTSVRARMEAMGEPYNVARRKILAEREAEQQLPEAQPVPAAATEPWRRVPWAAPLDSYYAVTDVDEQAQPNGNDR